MEKMKEEMELDREGIIRGLEGLKKVIAVAKSQKDTWLYSQEEVDRYEETYKIFNEYFSQFL